MKGYRAVDILRETNLNAKSAHMKVFGGA